MLPGKMKNSRNKTTQEARWPEVEDSQPRGGADALSYLTRLTRHRLLTSEEEIELAARVKGGDRHAKDKLVEANMRLVINIAKNYHCPLIPFEDLVQEGAIGLMTAAERYDARRGFRFSTYATHWIRQSISRAVDNKARAIRIPAHVAETLRKLERTRAQLLRQEGEEPSDEALANHLGMTPRKIAALLLAGQDPVSLDMLIGEEENTTLGALINDRTASDPEDAVLTAEVQAELKSLLAILTPREREIMQRRLGFDEESAQVLQEIGENMHISRERVRQIETIALKKLKYAAKRRDLHSYLSS
jgi:RNA polymerase primary sigma factor